MDIACQVEDHEFCMFTNSDIKGKENILHSTTHKELINKHSHTHTHIDNIKLTKQPKRRCPNKCKMSYILEQLCVSERALPAPRSLQQT